MRSIHHLGNNIYWLTFDNHYDLCMSFWRVSEMRESANPKMRDGMTLVDYMEWYAKEYGKGAFTYAADWHGFNVSDQDLKNTYCCSVVLDFNKYDRFMMGVQGQIESHLPGPYYLIGTHYKDTKTLHHEYAHALWYIDSDYQACQRKNIANLNIALLKKLYSNLLKMGYAPDVHSDEVQAYLSTDMPRDRTTHDLYKSINRKQFGKVAKPFIDTFQKALEKQEIP